jgi:L-glutamine-phosphate cytidylyltransferase
MAVVTQSIILAAGRGSRMGDLTAMKPKCLTVLAGKPLLDWQLAALRAAGMHSITVVGGYRKDLLTSERYQLLDNPDWADTNMVATLRCASALLRQTPCLISYGDILYQPDRVKTLAEVDADIAISYDTNWESLWRARFSNPLADAETFRQENGWLTTIGEKAERLSEIEGQYIGLLKFTPAGWAQVEQVLSTLTVERQRRIDMTNLLRTVLGHGTSIRCVPGAGAWCEVDDSADVHLYQRLLDDSDQAGKRWAHDWRW